MKTTSAIRVLTAALSLAFASSAVAAFSTPDEYRQWLEAEWYSDASVQLVSDSHVKGPYGAAYYLEQFIGGKQVVNAQVSIIADANGDVLYVEGPQLGAPLDALLSYDEVLEYAETLLIDLSSDEELGNWYDEGSDTVYPYYEFLGTDIWIPMSMPFPDTTRLRISAYDGSVITDEPTFFSTTVPTPFDHWERVGFGRVETPFGHIFDFGFPWVYRYGEGWLYAVDVERPTDTFIVWSPVLGWTYWFVDTPDYEYSYDYGWVWRSADRAWVYVLQDGIWLYAAS